MGFQVRKRTKGKSSWTNMSASKRGFHASQSFKSGNTTGNISPRGFRLTQNFGNGIRYVHNVPWSKKKKKTEDKPSWFERTINSIDESNKRADELKTQREVKYKKPEAPKQEIKFSERSFFGKIFHFTIEAFKWCLFIFIVATIISAIVGVLN